MRVVISGPPGSGKTTQARLVAEYFKLRYFSAGRIFREIAIKRGIGVEELSVVATRDPSIDIEVDRRTFEVAREDDIVIDAHLGAWIVNDLVDIRVYVTAPFTLRVLRIAARDNMPIDKAFRETVIREVTQKKRFKEFYGIDIDDLSIFDVVINTKNIDAKKAFEILKRVIESSL
ncbi:MAG: AAA family ATPase [Desulfurococcaceae archaeon]|jgi:cytidylate kinase|nr:AAA family ATPase [Desulfurococcaceae archaeon]